MSKPASASFPAAANYRRVTRWIVLGALASTFGIGLSVCGIAQLGSWVTLFGLGASIWSLHRFGRSGPR